jgi:hypothetical protein
LARKKSQKRLNFVVWSEKNSSIAHLIGMCI